jgi:hypothetical protein
MPLSPKPKSLPVPLPLRETIPGTQPEIVLDSQGLPRVMSWHTDITKQLAALGDKKLVFLVLMPNNKHECSKLRDCVVNAKDVQWVKLNDQLVAFKDKTLGFHAACMIGSMHARDGPFILNETKLYVKMRLQGYSEEDILADFMMSALCKAEIVCEGRRQYSPKSKWVAAVCNAVKENWKKVQKKVLWYDFDSVWKRATEQYETVRQHTISREDLLLKLDKIYAA